MLKIGQHLTKLEAKYSGTFFPDTLYIVINEISQVAYMQQRDLGLAGPLTVLQIYW